MSPPSRLARALQAAAIVAVTLAIVTLAAWLTPGPIGPLNEGIETLAARGSGWLDRLASLLPFGFAFGAGMVSAVNPCGFAMLPAYLGLFLGQEAATQDVRLDVSARLRKSLTVGGSVTLGFAALFGVVGLVFALGARWLADAFPYLGVATGIGLIAVAVWMWLGGSIYARFGEQLSHRLTPGSGSNLRGYVAFGVAFGLASLSCTLPIFLAVLGSSLTLGSLPAMVGQLLLFAMGMGSFVLALTLSMALFQGALVARARSALGIVTPLSVGLMWVAGAYIVYYWLTLGGLLPL